MYYTSFIRRIVFFDVIRADCFSKIRTAEWQDVRIPKSFPNSNNCLVFKCILLSVHFLWKYKGLEIPRALTKYSVDFVGNPGQGISLRQLVVFIETSIKGGENVWEACYSAFPWWKFVACKGNTSVWVIHWRCIYVFFMQTSMKIIAQIRITYEFC